MNQTLVVMGQGYVGLPLSQGATRAGWTVFGFDVNQNVVDGLNAGRSHIDDLSDQEIKEMVDLGFSATTDVKILEQADVVVICVPTPLAEDGSPDLAYVRQAAAAVGEHAKKGSLVVLESTTYPGTTERELVPTIVSIGRLKENDIAVAFSPERIDPGNKTYMLENTPKVVGGRTAGETDRAVAFYGSFIREIVPVNSPTEAEMAKLLENTYRHVNIALVNELARFSHELGIDIWNVIKASATKPFGFQAFYPGPGVGGHCIPIDPNYLSYEVKRALGVPFRFVELAQEINNTMPQFVVSRIQDLLNDQSKSIRDAKILLLGATYKAEIADQRESPSRPVAELLINKGASLSYFDPYVPTWNISTNTVLNAVSDVVVAASEADLIVVLQSHSAVDYDAILATGTPVFDTRGKLQGENVTLL